jgi:hypothetical protein
MCPVLRFQKIEGWSILMVAIAMPDPFGDLLIITSNSDYSSPFSGLTHGFSKSGNPQRELRQGENDANKLGKIRPVAAFTFQNRRFVKR